MKYYSCPVCKITSSGKLWNESTIEKYGEDNIGLIQTEEKDELLYVCPECKEENDGYKINFVYEDE